MELIFYELSLFPLLVAILVLHSRLWFIAFVRNYLFYILQNKSDLVGTMVLELRLESDGRGAGTKTEE